MLVLAEPQNTTEWRDPVSSSASQHALLLLLSSFLERWNERLAAFAICNLSTAANMLHFLMVAPPATAGGSMMG